MSKIPSNFKISPADALAKLRESGQLFQTLFEHGSLSVEIYQPKTVDLQQPHDRDEVYVVVAGSGYFELETERVAFAVGDFLFVPAGKKHKFVDFTDDFATWVLFYGPLGGEKTE